jgi:hypothetical protein
MEMHLPLCMRESSCMDGYRLVRSVQQQYRMDMYIKDLLGLSRVICRRPSNIYNQQKASRLILPAPKMVGLSFSSSIVGYL